MTTLIADIGGTNARFALQNDLKTPFSHLLILPCEKYAGILEAMSDYLSQIPKELRPSKGVLAIANPITGDQIQMTNNHWRFSIAELTRALGFESLRFVNDFTALALSLPHLASHDVLQIGKGTPQKDSTLALMGPGTGLGVSGLLPDAKDGFLPITGEGGHVSFAPENEEEEKLLAHLRTMFPHHESHISNEHLLCGNGLVALYRALCQMKKETPQYTLPAQISLAACQKEDETAHHALSLFCAFLGSAAGNLALTLGALGGVYIGGGMIPKMLDFFKASDFRARFEAKGRVRFYVENIPTYVITAPYPAFLGVGSLVDTSFSSQYF